MAKPTKLLLPLLAALLALALATADSPRTAPVPPASPAAAANPLAGAKLFVDRESPAWLEWQGLQRAGKTREAQLIWKIAREPGTRWVGRFTKPSLASKLGPYLDAAREEGAVAPLTVLRAQSTECGPRYLGGGEAEDQRTREWYSELAGVIGATRLVVAFEPDSLGTID